MTVNVEWRVGVYGIGTIGADVARRLDAGIPGLTLTALAGRDAEKTTKTASSLRHVPVVVADCAALVECCDIIVDCAPSHAFHAIANTSLLAGRVFVTVNAAALLGHMDIFALAKTSGGRMIVPTGSILGFDGVAAAAEGEILSVCMVTRKPPAGLAGAPYLLEQGIDLNTTTEAVCVFKGNARDAARAFPANVNVVAALSLAGIGPERTMVEIWSDPALTRNTQHYVVEADAVRFSVGVEGIPSLENPRTSRLTSQSVVAALRRLVSPIHIGT